MKYEARPGSAINDEQADRIGQEIDRMTAEGVPVTAPNFLARVEEEGHPLHGMFEWDDARAALKYRIEQARRYIASVVVVDVATGKRGRAAYSVSVSTSTTTRREFVPRETIKADDSSLLQVSAELYGRIGAALREADSLGLLSEQPWRRIADAHAKNEPKAVLLGGSAA